jgi:hypothetical protein
MLRGAGADVKVRQELPRHSIIQSTMNTCTQAVAFEDAIVGVYPLLHGKSPSRELIERASCGGG